MIIFHGANLFFIILKSNTFVDSFKVYLSCFIAIQLSQASLPALCGWEDHSGTRWSGRSWWCWGVWQWSWWCWWVWQYRWLWFIFHHMNVKIWKLFKRGIQNTPTHFFTTLNNLQPKSSTSWTTHQTYLTQFPKNKVVLQSISWILRAILRPRLSQLQPYPLLGTGSIQPWSFGPLTLSAHQICPHQPQYLMHRSRRAHLQLEVEPAD